MRLFMRYVRPFLLGLLDSCLAWFTPGWRRKGNDTLSALTRYINYFRPSLGEERLAELIGLRREMKAALLNWNQAEVERLTALIGTKAESLRGFKRNPLAEAVESFFVIMVVFMGIRTYYAQPFRIPTGSMQPSLNGIIIHPIDEIPSAPERWWNKLVLGSSYIDEVAPQDMTLIGMKDTTVWLLFTETVLTFRGHEDGSTITISVPSATGTIIEYLKEHGKITEIETPVGRSMQYGSFRKGETIIRGRVDAGDMVLVNRMAYHFRKPERGETFVFDTRGIQTKASNKLIADQGGGTHYIKRLCGLPGDTLEVKSPQLLVNGQPAQEPGIARVAAARPPFNATGYQTLDHLRTTHLGKPVYLSDAGPATLRCPENPNLREYAALGDNTTNSLDSRYWGPVRQFNIIGPAAFTLWPFTGHWGSID